MQSPVKKATLVASVLLSLTLSHTAFAQTKATSLGVVTGQVSFEGTTSPGTFDDFYNFTVSPNGGSVFVATSVVYAGIGDDVTSLSLYSGTYSSPIAAAALAIRSATTDTPIDGFTLHTTIGSSGVLSPGDYTLQVEGTAVGTSAYTGTFALAPVPEPKSYALLLAGLGMMGTLAQRRRKSRE